MDCFHCMSNTLLFHLLSPLNICRGFTLLLFCTQAKLFITKGMVFVATFTIFFVCVCAHEDALANHNVSLVNFSCSIQIHKESIQYVLPSALLRAMVKCQGFEAAPL